MSAAVGLLRDALRGLDAGRVRAALLEPVRVEIRTADWGDTIPLGHIATINVMRSARALRIVPFDPAHVHAITRAIHAADLGLNPQAAATTIVVPVPRPDADGKARLVARARTLTEEQRIAVRVIRKHARNRAKRKGELDTIGRSLDALTRLKTEELNALLAVTVAEIEWVDPRFNR